MVENPKPLLDDTTKSSDHQTPVPLPSVIEENNHNTTFDNDISKEPTEPSPRVETTPTVLHIDFSAKIEHNNKLCDVQSLSSKNHERPFTLFNPLTDTLFDYR